MRAPVALLAIAEMVAFFAAICIAFYLVSDSETRIVDDVLAKAGLKAGIVSIVMLLSFLAMGLYQFHQRIDYLEIVARVLIGLVFGSIGLTVIYFVFPPLGVELRTWAISMVVAAPPVFAFRYYFLRHVDENIFRRNVLIVGAGDRSAGIAALRRRADRRGFRIVGTVPMPGDSGCVDNGKIIRDDKSLLEIAHAHEVDDIVIALEDRRGTLPIRELLDCKLSGIDVLDLLEFLERESGKIRADLVSPGWLIFSSGFRVSKLRQFLKRSVDIAVSVSALLFIWPILMLVALCIKIEDGLSADVFYRQFRIGLNGELFELVKFRSMDVDAESDGEPVWACENDKRITRVGRVIRKFRIDEFPQFLTVLRGKMSIVGPRPERPEFIKRLSKSIPYYNERHSVKPGVTGWAQLHYSYGSSTEDAIEKLHYDLYYVKNHNLILDIAIMIQTVEVLFWGKGAR